MEQFTYSENTINRLMSKIRFRITLFTIIVLVVSVGFTSYSDRSNNIETTMVSTLIFVGSVALALFLTLYFTFKRVKKRLKSYVLTITDTAIIRTQDNTPTIRHFKSEITEITKYANGAVSIKAKSMNDMIGVTSNIEDFDKLESLLNEIKPINYQPKNDFTKPFAGILFLLIVAASFLGLMSIFFMSKTMWVVEITGVLLITLMAYYISRIYISQNVDRRTRRIMFFALIPMLSIINKMYLISSPNYGANGATNKDKMQINMPQEADDELLTSINIFTKAPKDQAKDYENGLISGIKLDNIDADIRTLDNPDSIVLNENHALIEIDYPLDSTYFGELKTTNKGFTRRELVKEISKKYQQIYKEEEATATIKTLPPDKRGNTINRNDTNGKYGIWGHDLADLYLVAIEVYKNKEGKIVIRLTIES